MTTPMTDEQFNRNILGHDFEDSVKARMAEERLEQHRLLRDEIRMHQRVARLGYIQEAFADAVDDNDRPRAEVERLRAEKDGAYHERNQVVAALAKLFPSGVAVDPDEPDWPVLYIDLPDGQVSWHFQRSEAIELLAGIPKYDGEWDGHSTEEKYARLKSLAPRYFNLADFLRGPAA